MQPIPWRELVKLALIGTLLAATAVLIDLDTRGNRNPLSFIEPAEEGPSVAVFHLDFPQQELPHGIGHDGQQFYAIARQPMHLDAVAPQLDRPQYRLQRPLLPWLAWLMHPQGGGRGLVWALFAVEILAMFIGGIAFGALSLSIGGPVWLAAIFPLLPGSVASARITGADALATALVVAALACAMRNRWAAAVVLAVAAVLAKEPVLLVLVGYALWRRDRRGVAIAAVPAAVAAGWALWLRYEVPASGRQVQEFTWPFGGLWDSLHLWVHGHEVFALVTVVGALVLAGIGLTRHRLDWPLGWALALEVAFTLVLGINVVGLNFNGTRTTLPLQALVVLALVAHPDRHDGRPAGDALGSTGVAQLAP